MIAIVGDGTHRGPYATCADCGTPEDRHKYGSPFVPHGLRVAPPTHRRTVQ